MKILLIDDNIEFCEIFAEFSRNLGYEVTSASCAQEGLKLHRSERYDLLVIDLILPDSNGIELIRKIKTENSNPLIILISGASDIIESINTIELGVFDFMTKPINMHDIERILSECKSYLEKQKNQFYTKMPPDKALEYPYIPQTRTIDAKSKIDIYDISFKNDFSIHLPPIDTIAIYSKKLLNSYHKIKKLSAYPEIPVLITGETGTGKEIIARYFHFCSQRKDKPFVGLNCAAINKDLFESELFGYKKGAFTGAHKDGSRGKLEYSGEGTLFLDEVSEIPPDIQAKLLRLLQERTYYKIGDNTLKKINSHIICASNADLKNLTFHKAFRQDLYFRLNVCEIHLPPLRKRREEILPLIVFFMKKNNEKLGTDVRFIKKKDIAALQEYDWPGNVRELENMVLRSMLLHHDRDFKSPSMIPQNKPNIKPDKRHVINPVNFSIPHKPFEIETYMKKIVKKTLKMFKGNKTKTAKFLGLSPIQMYKRYKVEDE